MAITTKSKQRIRHAASGFTLVEMLVSVTLVLLMMTLFTSIFEMATNSVNVQQGIAKNDQRARALTTTLSEDFAKRSFRYALPYYPTESSATSPTVFGNRAGYIYISTNNPDSWQDDILQFTIDISQTQESGDTTPVFGSAKLLYDLAADPGIGAGAPRRTTLRANPNQPDADDGDLKANQVASSKAAEVSIFIRDGGLYRRVMLLREPLPVAGEELAIQPVNISNLIPTPYFVRAIANGAGAFAYVATPLAINQTDGGNVNHFALGADDPAPRDWNVTASNDFWRHFDFSAVPIPLAGALPTSVNFVGIDALDNSQTLPIASLGIPRYRFGFNSATGLSREHDSATSLLFIGRFLHAETSHPYFNWPLAASRVEPGESVGSVSLASINAGGLLGNGNPMDLVGTPLNLDQSNGVISQFQGATGRGGNRRVEDLLLANVHGFRVEIWDERLQKYVTPANNSTTQLLAGGALRTVVGDFHVGRRLNAAYGPFGAAAPAANHVFDTWNPTVGPIGAPVPPPFIPYRYYPPRQTDGAVAAGAGYGAPSGPGPSLGTFPNPYLEYDSERLTTNENKGFWVPSDHVTDPMNPVFHNYAVGDVVFAVPTVFVQNGVSGWDADRNNVFEWGTGPGRGDQDSTIVFPLPIAGTANPGFPPQGFQIAYRCIQAGRSASLPPTWPREPGQRVAESNGVGGTAVWESLDNRQPVRSLRVTVQFFEEKTEKLRQLSLVLPLTTDR